MATAGAATAGNDAERVVLHCDMDAFYASIEARDAPALAGKAVVVGGRHPRGVVMAASYAARRFGVHSAMPMKEALRRCPEAVVIAPRMDHYRAVSAALFKIFRDFADRVESIALDEAYLEFDPAEAAAPEALAAAIKSTVRATLDLTVSIGIGPNKLLAKIASKLGKPDGLYRIRAAEAAGVLAPMPAGTLWGIGPRTRDRLAGHGIATAGDLSRAPAALLKTLLGRQGEYYRRLACGIDDRPVSPNRPLLSVSWETTFPHDLTAGDELTAVLNEAAAGLSERLRRRNLAPATLTLKLRRADFAVRTRQGRLRPPSNTVAVLAARGAELLNGWLADHPGARLRLLGLGASDFAPRNQADMFEKSLGLSA